jgi:hypothetical protein
MGIDSRRCAAPWSRVHRSHCCWVIRIEVGENVGGAERDLLPNAAALRRASSSRRLAKYLAGGAMIELLYFQSGQSRFACVGGGAGSGAGFAGASRDGW